MRDEDGVKDKGTDSLTVGIDPTPLGVCGTTKSDIVSSGEREPMPFKALQEL